MTPWELELLLIAGSTFFSKLWGWFCMVGSDLSNVGLVVSLTSSFLAVVLEEAAGLAAGLAAVLEVVFLSSLGGSYD